MEIIGHEDRRALLMRLADRRALAHGYLFFGPDQVGKRQVALGLAHYLERGVFASSEDSTQRSRSSDTVSPAILGDLLTIQRDDKGSIGVDAVRSIRAFLWQRPNRSSYRTVICDDADLMTDEATNAILKTAEEPPSSAVVILIASDREAVRPTVVSRLVPLYFASVATPRIARWLTETHSLSHEEAEQYALRAGGAPGRAHALLTDKQLKNTLALAKAILLKKAHGRRELIKKIVQAKDFNFTAFLDALALELSHPALRELRGIVWHSLLELRGRAALFNLNARIQLEALTVHLP